MLPKMIRRLLLALLVACLALPAAAAPLHCAQTTVVVAHGEVHHGKKHEAPQQVTPAHDCIGCIAPFAGPAPALASVWYPPSPILTGGPLPVARQVSGPDTPPPKS